RPTSCRRRVWTSRRKAPVRRPGSFRPWNSTRPAWRTRRNRRLPVRPGCSSGRRSANVYAKPSPLLAATGRPPCGRVLVRLPMRWKRIGRFLGPSRYKWCERGDCITDETWRSPAVRARPGTPGPLGPVRRAPGLLGSGRRPGGVAFEDAGPPGEGRRLDPVGHLDPAQEGGHQPLGRPLRDVERFGDLDALEAGGDEPEEGDVLVAEAGEAG